MNSSSHFPKESLWTRIGVDADGCENLFFNTERCSDHFSSFLKCFLDEGEKGSGIDRGLGVKIEADDRGVDFRPWVKTAGGDGELTVDAAIKLDKEGEGAVVFGAAGSVHPFCDFFLHHESGGRKEGSGGSEFVEDGRGDVVGEVGDDFEGRAEMVEGKLEEVGFYDTEALIGGLEAEQLFGEGAIHFDSEHLRAGSEKRFREGAGSGADFEHRVAGRDLGCLDDFTDNIWID